MHKFKPNYLTYSILATLTISTAYAENSTTQDQLNEIVVSGNACEVLMKTVWALWLMAFAKLKH